jgi:hypothetical protein
MGQQQLLLIILGVIIVGIAIAVGISMFSSSSVQSNKDAIINDLNNLAANAYQFRIRPTTMGGGGGSYTGGSGFAIPTKLASNDNGTFSRTNAAQAVTFIGTSAQGYGTVTAVCDSTGRLGTFTYTGQFQ